MNKRAGSGISNTSAGRVKKKVRAGSSFGSNGLGGRFASFGSSGKGMDIDEDTILENPNRSSFGSQRSDGKENRKARRRARVDARTLEDRDDGSMPSLRTIPEFVEGGSLDPVARVRAFNSGSSSLLGNLSGGNARVRGRQDASSPVKNEELKARGPAVSNKERRRMKREGTPDEEVQPLDVQDPPPCQPFAGRPGEIDRLTRSRRVSSLWCEQLRALGHWGIGTHAALDGSQDTDGRTLGSELEVVHSLAKTGAAQQRVERVPDSCLGDTSLAVHGFLLLVANGDTAEAIEAGLAGGCLKLSKIEDIERAVGQVTYTRIAAPLPVCRNDAEASPSACMKRYLRAYPADFGWAMAWLMALGESPKTLQGLVEKVAVSCELDPSVVPTIWATVQEVAVCFRPSRGYPLYFGISDHVSPAERQRKDEGKSLHSRLTNYIHRNAKYLEWHCYEIPELCVPTSAGFRVDIAAGDKETVLIQVGGPLLANQAVGGYIPRFLSDDNTRNILDQIRPSCTGLYGSTPCPVVSDAVKEMLDEQKKYLEENVVGTTMAASSYRSALQNGPYAFRTSNAEVQRVDFVRLMDIISLEDLQSRRGSEEVGGIWDVNTGRALRSYRHILSTILPQLGRDDNLTPPLIAADVGPTMDVWAFTAKPVLFWNHALWLSRILVRMGIIVSTTWGEPVHAIMAGGFLGLAWKSVPQEQHGEILDGVTPREIESMLPQTESLEWRPHCVEFMLRLGVAFITVHGPRLTDLHISIPNLHPGGIKHDPSRAYLYHKLITLIEALCLLFLIEKRRMEEEGIVMDRSSREQACGYLNALIARVEGRAVALGLREELDRCKEELISKSWALGHLRMRNVGPQEHAPHAPAFQIPGITHAVGGKHSQERQQQFEALRQDYQDRCDTGRYPDPFSLIPYQFWGEPYGVGMRTWFLSRKENCRLSNAARVYGRDEASNKIALETHAAFGRNTAAQSLGGTRGVATQRRQREEREDPIRMLMEGLDVLGRWRENSTGVSKTSGSRSSANVYRFGWCPWCEGLVVACDKNSKHACERGQQPVVITNGRFPLLRVWVLPHQALHIREILALVADRLHEVKLIPVKVAEILGRSENRDVLNDHLPGFNPRAAGDMVIYRRTDEKDPGYFELTCAVDACLEFVSSCPPKLWPVLSGSTSRAWAWKGAGGINGLYPGNDRVVLSCNWGWVGVCTPKNGVYAHVCERARRLAEAQGTPVREVEGGRETGGIEDCNSVVRVTQHKLEKKFDLPPEHLRAIWVHERIFPMLIFEAKKGVKKGGGKKSGG
ncbi:hypothetical protein R3P38DRAFT_3168845 [Favolaschia claudopus]|uniref:Uncharacterized protein n=1 Tax=Favolaschia claudopus TaxID=2862362 RepID=A0AAW0DZI5_9AGAR